MNAKELFNENECIGVIYSKSEGDYTLKICDHGKDIVPETWRHNVKHFNSLENAKAFLKSYSVNKAFLALDTTYDEFGPLDVEAHKTGHEGHFDFMPISLE
jgi:hypothetical protein